jgi:hypothetical protein
VLVGRENRRDPGPGAHSQQRAGTSKRGQCAASAWQTFLPSLRRRARLHCAEHLTASSRTSTTMQTMIRGLPCPYRTLLCACSPGIRRCLYRIALARLARPPCPRLAARRRYRSATSPYAPRKRLKRLSLFTSGTTCGYLSLTPSLRAPWAAGDALSMSSVSTHSGLLSSHLCTLLATALILTPPRAAVSPGGDDGQGINALPHHLPRAPMHKRLHVRASCHAPLGPLSSFLIYHCAGRSVLEVPVRSTFAHRLQWHEWLCHMQDL